MHQWYIGTGHGRQQRKQTQSWRNYSSSSSSSRRRRGGEKKKTTKKKKKKAKTKNTRNKINATKTRKQQFFSKAQQIQKLVRDGEILSPSESLPVVLCVNHLFQNQTKCGCEDIFSLLSMTRFPKSFTTRGIVQDFIETANYGHSKIFLVSRKHNKSDNQFHLTRNNSIFLR